MKNKFLTLIVIVGLMITSLTTVKATEEYSYEIMEDGNVRIVEFPCVMETIEIPATVDGHTVTEIAADAVDCSVATAIVIPDTVTHIDKGAFYNCILVTKLTIPVSVKATEGFSDLLDVNVLTLTEGTGEMVDYEHPWETPWYDSSRSITELYLPRYLKRIGSNSFVGFTRVANVKLPTNLEEIGERAFYNWSSLSELQLPETVKVLERGSLGLDNIYSSNCATILLNAYLSVIEEDALAEGRNYRVFKGSYAEEICSKRMLEYESVELNFENLKANYDIGDEETLAIKELPYEIANYVVFTSSNPEIVSVAKNGGFTALGSGTAVITADVGFASISEEITVREPDNATKYIRIPIDDFYELSPRDDFMVNEYTYDCSEEVASDLMGDYYNPSEPGLKTIKVVNNGKVIGVYLINAFVPSLGLFTSNEEDFNMTVTSDYKLVTEVYPDDATYTSCLFESDDPEVLKVGNDGLITALNLGEAHLTVTSADGLHVKNYTIKVLDNNMTVAVKALPLLLNHSFTLQISNYGKVSFYSSDEEICTVDDEGVIHAEGLGECYIMAFSEDNTAARSIKVKVYEGFAQGVDVSEWQGYLSSSNYEQMRKYGVDFVIMRAALNDDYKDKCFESNYLAAREAGMKIGVYHYVNCLTVEEAVEQAEFMVSCIKGKRFEYPVIMDIENSAQRNLSNEEFNAIVDTYCSIIELNGYKAMIYSNASMLNKLSPEVSEKYDIWQAHWGTTVPSVYTREYTIWQFTSDGRVPGIRGRVDCNIAFFDYPTYMKENHLNGY